MKKIIQYLNTPDQQGETFFKAAGQLVVIAVVFALWSAAIYKEAAIQMNINQIAASDTVKESH